MDSPKIIPALIAVVFLALLGIAFYIFWTRPDYSNAAYGFSFDYPGGIEAREVSDGLIQVGDEPIATVRVLKANASTTYDNYNDFIHTEASTVCTSLGTTSSCGTVTRDELYSSTSGVSGAVFYLTYSTRSGTATTTREAGPFYAFPLRRVPDSEYTALLIYPARFAEEGDLFDRGSQAAHDISNSLKIER